MRALVMAGNVNVQELKALAALCQARLRPAYGRDLRRACRQGEKRMQRLGTAEPSVAWREVGGAYAVQQRSSRLTEAQQQRSA